MSPACAAYIIKSITVTKVHICGKYYDKTAMCGAVQQVLMCVIIMVNLGIYTRPVGADHYDHIRLKLLINVLKSSPIFHSLYLAKVKFIPRYAEFM